MLESDGWLMALKSSFISPVTHVRETPVRLLIKQFPDLAKRAFDRCLLTNLQSDSKQLAKQKFATVSSDDPRFSITCNYELLDDTYCLFEDDDDKSVVRISMEGDDGGEEYDSQGQVDWAESEIWDDAHHLVPEAQPYCNSATVMKLNHPLMIMVKEQRTASLDELRLCEPD